MKLFKEKETLGQTIPFMALMAALNVTFVLLSNFIPFLIFLLLFILPLCCTLVILLCKKRYFPIYFFSTIGLCFICAFWNYADTIFYVIPSLITGALFGIMIEQNVHYSISIFSCSLLQCILSYILIPLVGVVTQVDILEFFAQVFNFSNSSIKGTIEVFLVFIYGFLQQLVTYLFIRFGLKNLNFKVNENNNILAIIILNGVNLTLTPIIAYIMTHLMYIFFFASLYFTVFLIVWLCKKKNTAYIIALVVGIVMAIFTVALTCKYLDYQFQPLLFQIYCYEVEIISIVEFSLVKKYKN